MKGINTSYETNKIRHNAKDDVKVTNVQSDKITKTEKEKNIKENGTVFAGNLNLKQDPVGERAAKAQKDALKEIMDTFSDENAVDQELQKRRENIAGREEDIKENLTEMADLRSRAKALEEKYAAGEINAEEAGAAAGFYEQVDALQAENKEARKVQAEDNAYIEGVYKERLKRHDMVDSQKTAQDIRKEASEEIKGMLVQDAVDHIDETFKENEDKTDKSKENKNDIKDPAEKQKETMKDMQSAVLKGEAEKRVAELKMTREDTRGIAYDTHI